MLLAFPWDQPVLEGEGEAPPMLPVAGDVGACGAVCGAALGMASLQIAGLEKKCCSVFRGGPPALLCEM